MAKEFKLTRMRLKELEDELKYLKTTREAEVAEQIKEARSFGDLSENSEYDEAKNEQAKVEGRIAELEEMLKNITVIDDSKVNADEVHVGSRVKVYDEEWDEETVYDVVGSTEADPMANKISDQSPIGMALIGNKVGDVVHANTPGGEVTLRILEIERN